MKNKNILVTGSEGFVGKALIKELKAKNGFTVFSLDKSEGDISLMELNFRNIDHVIHLAAKTFVPDSWENPLPFYQVNILGTANVLEFCRKNNVNLTVLSSYVYGSPDTLPISEEHSRKAFNPYCLSKVLMEDLCDFYSKIHHLNIVVLRPFNIYGPGQSDNFLIPKIIKQVLSKEQLKVTVMDLTPKRDFIFIDDLVKAILLSINYNNTITLNIGSGVSISVLDIVKLVMHKAGVKKEVESKNIDRPNEVPNVICDNTLLTKTLGWSLRTDFDEGIKKCIDYYRQLTF